MHIPREYLNPTFVRRHSWYSGHKMHWGLIVESEDTTNASQQIP
jgi:hypothetical protein